MFTGVETVMISLFTSFLSCAGTIVAMSKKFVVKGDCFFHHQTAQREDDGIKEKLERINDKQDLQFRMLRIIIIHMDMPNDKKGEILNMRAE